MMTMRNWVDPEGPSSGRSRSGNGNDNDNGDGEEGTQGSEKATRKGKGTKEGRRKGRAREMVKGKVLLNTPQGR